MQQGSKASSTPVVQRVFAVSALVASFAATVVVAAGAGGGPDEEAIAQAREPVAAADAALARRLQALAPGESTKPARRAAAAAHQAGQRALEVLGAPTSRPERVAVSELRRHQQIVDAIGSTLANPRSRLRDVLRRYAARTELPVTAFLRYTRARLER